MVNPEVCIGCRYVSGGCCDYIGFTGHSKGVQNGDVCTVRMPLNDADIHPCEMARRQRKMDYMIKRDLVLKLCKEGLDDEQIAEKIGGTRKSIAKIRGEVGVKLTNHSIYRAYDRHTGTLLAEGTGSVVAKALGIHSSTIYGNVDGVKRSKNFTFERIYDGGNVKHDSSRRRHSGTTGQRADDGTATA